MNIINVDISFEKQTCITTGNTLITGDYNSTKLIFNFDKSEGRKVFEMISPDNKLVFSDEIQNNEVILSGNDAENNSCSIFNKEGYYTFEVSLYGENSKLTSMYGRLYVEKEKVNIDGELVEVYLPIFDKLLKNVDNSLKEMESIKEKVVIANEEANNIINEFNNNVDDTINKINKIHDDTAVIVNDIDNKLNAYNTNASEKLSVYNTNASEKLSFYNTNVANQNKAFNDNAKDKLDLYNQNDTTKTAAFNDNATNKTTAFNSNANSNTETYNNNHNEKLNTYNTNVANKTTEFNTNATSKLNAYNTNADTKLQEYNTNADNKILEYDEHSQELNNKIIDTRNELERVKNDVLETGTDTDTFVHLEDSAMAEYQELSIDGVCEQKTTSGKNLLETTSGTYTISDSHYKDTPTGILISEDMIGKKVSCSATIKTSNITTTTTLIYFVLGYGTIPTSGMVKQIKVSTYGVESGTYKPKIENAEITSEMVGNYLVIRYSGFSQKSTITIEYSNAQLEFNSTSTEYEPYTGGQPSPSPDYPQEIKTIENSLKITSCNKNLLDDTKLVITSGNGAKKIDSEGKITSIDPINDGRGYGYKYCDYFFTLGKGSYYLYYEIITPTASKNAYMNIYNGNNRIYVSNFANKTGIISTKFTLEDFSNMGIEFKLFDGEIRLWILKDGVQDTSYEKHLETQIEANLPENEFIGKINDTYKDTLKVEYNEEDGQYHLNLYKNVGKVVLDSSENWNLFFSTNGIFINTTLITSINSSDTINCLSNYYINTYSRSYIRSHLDSVNNVCATNGGEIIIANKSITSIDDFKTWLSTHNTELYYVLETPYTVDLGIVDQLITYNEITNLFTDSDLLPTINAKYYRNFISTVKNLQVNEKALKQELIDINNRLSELETAQTSVASESEVIE